MLDTFVYQGATPSNWSSTIHDNQFISIFYRISPLFYSIGGITILFLHSRLTLFDPYFRWILFAAFLIFQGFISYMADVQFCGLNTYWQTFDIYLASFLTFIGGPLLLFRCFYANTTYPFIFKILWLLSIFFALYCKFMSKQAILTLNVQDYLFWHSLWHCLPLYAILLLFLLCFYK